MWMNEKDKHFIEGYEKLLNKGYCNCNEMNCIDNNSPRRILNIVKQLEQENKALKETIEQLYRELNTANMSEEVWLDYAINYNLEQLDPRCLVE